MSTSDLWEKHASSNQGIADTKYFAECMFFHADFFPVISEEILKVTHK